jgi:DNA polymerase I-like protein with 3'-5' exonuclease and polymerase domains
MELIGLDIETESLDPDHPEYSLQPWRVGEGKAHITSIAVDLEHEVPRLATLDELREFKNCRFVAHNAMFDIAWLFASGFPVGRYPWLDSMLLEKWVSNGQSAERGNFSWGLAAAVERNMSDLPWASEFVEMKELADEDRDEAYWQGRACMDATATRILAQRCMANLTAQQQRSALIEASCLVPLAMSWVRGIPMAIDECRNRVPVVAEEMDEIESRLGVRVPMGQRWQPSPRLRSPKQMGELLYKTWALPIDESNRTPTGQPGTSKAALTYLADIDPRPLELLRWRKFDTTLSKFLNGPVKAAEYLGSHTLHPVPKIFSAYTGRLTYGSKIKNKFPVGMPLHQFPRPAAIRDLIRAPKGYALVSFDASGQERRIIADLSKDPTMVQIFNSKPPYDDIHSALGAELAGIPLGDFLRLKAEGKETIVGPQGHRAMAKMLNHACAYRIGAKSFRRQARVDYSFRLDIIQSKGLINRHNLKYPGLVRYWRDAILKAKHYGYAETLAGRRFHLTEWHGNDWGTEQSAINHPVQGTGADMKYLAMATVYKKYPELLLAWDLHDGIYYFVKIQDLSKDLVLRVKDTLDNLDYKAAWGWEPTVQILWDAAVGATWGTEREVK